MLYEFTVLDKFVLASTSQGSKAGHFQNIHRQTGVAFEDMLFLDNEMGNCRTVARLGVNVAYTPDGVTSRAWTMALEKFRGSRVQ